MQTDFNNGPICGTVVDMGQSLSNPPVAGSSPAGCVSENATKSGDLADNRGSPETSQAVTSYPQTSSRLPNSSVEVSVEARLCLHCQRAFAPGRVRSNSHNPGRYCSRKCAGHAPKRAVPFFTPPSTKKERIRANGLINMRIRRGAMERPNACQRCNKEGRVDGHHDDYSQPDKVVFLCRSCHVLRHLELARLTASAN
jgi:hypothetical protein